MKSIRQAVVENLVDKAREGLGTRVEFVYEEVSEHELIVEAIDSKTKKPRCLVFLLLGERVQGGAILDREDLKQGTNFVASFDWTRDFNDLGHLFHRYLKDGYLREDPPMPAGPPNEKVKLRP